MVQEMEEEHAVLKERRVQELLEMSVAMMSLAKISNTSHAAKFAQKPLQ